MIRHTHLERVVAGDQHAKRQRRRIGTLIAGTTSVAAVHEAGASVDLNTRLIDAPGWQLGGAAGINDPGQIIAVGNNGHFPADLSRRGFILTPLFGRPGDVDGDGDVDLTDLALLLGAFGTCDSEVGFNSGADFDVSGCVDLADLATLLGSFGA